jgi:pimeloyl-ACP methyl ester carboxylesterase
MSVTARLVAHLSVGILALTTGVAATRAQSAADPSGSATFLVLVNGANVGTERVSLTRNGSGWLVSGTGHLQVPIDQDIDRFDLTYSADWQPEHLTVDGRLRGQPLLITGAFGPASATSEVTRGTQHATATHQVSARTIVLPTNVFVAYEILALRAAGSPVGTRLPVYLAPNGESTATIVDVAAKRVSIGASTLELRVVHLNIALPSGVVPVEIWIDDRGRLARLSLPASSIVAIRDDLASVMAHEERIVNPGDQDVFIGADGFNLAATISRAPSAGARPLPAVVFVSAPGPQDRDGTVFGIPVIGQLAGALADAGLVAVRYDARGVGRSGGRTESARMSEYSDDAERVIAWLRKRKDVDADAIAVAGYGDAGPIALLTASRDKHVAGVVLLAAPAGTGRAITLDRQQRVLAPLPLSPSEKTARVALETRVIEAVETGNGWEALPEELRDQADTPWFRSWLEYDPTALAGRIRQPVLIVQGALDREVPAEAADALAAVFAAREKSPPTATRTVVVPGVNHLFVPATTGAVDEYPTLSTRRVAPDVPHAMAEWLKALR